MKKCKVDGCNNGVYAKDFCNKHYQQFRKYGEELMPPKKTICSVPNCENIHCAKGYCQKHYNQIKLHGCILERTICDKNEIIEYDDHAEIVIYNRQHEEIARALIDLEDIDKVKDIKWHLNSKGYIVNDNVGRLHRFLLNPSDNEIVDHKNHNPLDNRRCNLRICTKAENNMNVSKQRRNTTSKYKGVCWMKNNRKWRAQIRINRKSKHIGLYDSEEEAAKCYDEYAIKHFGVYAHTNFPIENYIEYILNLGLNPSDFGIDIDKSAE